MFIGLFDTKKATKEHPLVSSLATLYAVHNSNDNHDYYNGKNDTLHRINS